VLFRARQCGRLGFHRLLTCIWSFRLHLVSPSSQLAARTVEAHVSGPPLHSVEKPSVFPLVALLTGGGDKPYALGIVAALTDEKIPFDFIGSDDLAVPEVLESPFVCFLNLRGDQNPTASAVRKLMRVVIYYVRLFAYAISSKAPIFHILWHNKFDWFDRTLLLVFYRLLGKRIVYTAHNVNTQARDGKDSAWNRFTLQLQYRFVNHVFVHTTRMKDEIIASFQVPDAKISVIPFGINATNPSTSLTRVEARAFFGLEREDKTILFFGNVAEYKGLDLLVRAFDELVRSEGNVRLIIAGRIKCASSHWEGIRDIIASLADPSRVIQRIEYVPDEEVEYYFKAADVLVLPYREIFQSGVLFLGYNFGLPVIGSDVGSLQEEIIEGETGLVCKPHDSSDLARALKKYFNSPLYLNLEANRSKIRAYAHERYSWSKVARITTAVYSHLVGTRFTASQPASSSPL
jgi:D-inositol-3-phosphate glycosyltransferase